MDSVCLSVDLPRDDDHKVHDVPHVPQVAAGVQDESLSQDLEARLHGEDAQEVGLGGFLKTQRIWSKAGNTFMKLVLL